VTVEHERNPGQVCGREASIGGVCANRENSTDLDVDLDRERDVDLDLVDRDRDDLGLVDLDVDLVAPAKAWRRGMRCR